MGYEVEIKYRTDDHAGLAGKLLAMGASPSSAIDQEDTYLNHPARDFAMTGEAFRLRREDRTNRVTYKGPRQAGPAKTREEIEVAFDDGPGARAEMSRMFELLGFRTVAVLRKRRESFSLEFRGRHLEVGLDEAEDVGTFAEVEAIARDAADLPAAQAAVVELAAVLLLSEVEPRSYLRMALEFRGMLPTAGDDPGPHGGRNPAGQT